MKTIHEPARVMSTCMALRLIGFCVTVAIAVSARGEVKRVLEPLKPGEIVARGWLKGQLELSLAGMGGHLGEIEPDQMEKPYVTRDYDPANGARGKVGWCAEMGGEYALGAAMLAYALDDSALIAKAAARVKAAMALQEPDGYLGAFRPGDNRQEDYNAWGCHWFYNTMLLEYYRTGDQTILDAVHRGLLWFVQNWSGEKKTDYAGPTIIEPASVVYKLTGDKRLLDFCEAYAAWLDKPGHRNGATFATFPLTRHGYHVAAIAARLKAPAALAYASGKRAFLDAALKSHGDFHDGVGWQATYAPCADGEWVAAPSCVGETEYCDFIFYQQLFAWFASLTGDVGFADATERLVFNAAQGARAKDERTIGYMTSPNQWYATLDSSRWGPEPFYHVYAPNMNAACCPANSISLYPFYVLNAVSREGRDLRIMNYGPYDVRTKIDGTDVRVTSETDYPFGQRVTLRVKAKGWKGALRLRRPAWAESVAVARERDPPAAAHHIDGRVARERDRIITIPGPWNADEELVTIDFGWQPKVRIVRDRDFVKDPLKTVEWGALVFAQPVVEKWSRVERPKPGWGKDSAPPQPKDWPWLAINCEKEPVAYALPRDLKPSDIRVERTGAAGLPWQKPPVKLVVPMLRASAAYPMKNRREPGVGSKYKGTHTPLPAAGLVDADAGAVREHVELVPFGATCLRTTCFPTARGGQETLSLLSWNTEHYGWERRSVEERKLLEDNMFELVRAANPDIFLMQETYGSFERFKAALPGYDARLLGRCNCIFSRFPIVATHEPYREKGNYGEPNGGAFNLQVAELDVGGMRLRVCPMAMFWLPYCVRTPAGLTADQLLAWENERQNYDAAPRPQAISGILAGMAPFLAERDDVPILVAGDFNSHSHLDWTPATGSWPGHGGRTVPWQVSTRMANAGFTDVFRSLYPDPAACYGATFPVPGVMPQHARPFLRLDYVYAAGRRLSPLSMEVISGPYHRPFVWHGKSFSAFPSDHAAVLARLAVDTSGKPAASVYDAGLYSQVPLTDVSDANRATFIADAKAAGVDAVWISVVDFFEEEARRKPVLDHLAAEIRHFEATGFAVGVWINAFGYGNHRPFFKDSVKITTLEGKEQGGAVCPLDPKLRRALIDNVRDIARAGARFILMDDDYVQSARGLVGCSCPRHLARVAAKCGRASVTCEDVKAAFTGAPNAVRTAYLDVTGEVAVELARELRRVLDEVNPAVGMGFCASYTHWDVEGCDLLELVGAFAGKGRKVLRISGAPYWANSKLPGTGLADIIEFVRMQSAWTRGLDMTVFDENDPYPRKVARVPPWRCELYDKAIIADGHLARHKYMLCYGPDRAEPGYLEAHLANLPDDAKLRRIFAGTEPYGVKVECPQHRLRTATLPTPFVGERQITALYSQPAAAFELRRKGIPTRFDGPAASDEPPAVTVKASPDVYQIVHCDRAKGEYAVLLENMGNAPVDVKIAVTGKVRVIESLRGEFTVLPDGLSLAQLPPHAYAAVRFGK